ncbi:dCTP deaminase [Natranaeroarchaeum aerophilus]|uniref:dCTP deaminase n=1 Tax=Natranaeroarchaeum aerophilus TaxID=2917711 RepID=A0AAE3FSL7_9EURY|nr:dCTP deaminase [Natranaeroarchaeum aerophilus]MCL9814416.1 dCTP deaminase [Natranaeroarchaeum aerophilus]
MPTVSELLDAMDGIVHQPTQQHDDRVDLTVTEVYEIEAPGRVDFGGGELEAAELVAHDRTWRNDDDEYQWWHLDAGQYLIEYNERLDIDERAVLQIRDELRARGALHPTLHVESLSLVPLSVGGAGIYLKENARVSTLLAGE